jgi:hypothetical protein
MTRFISIRGFGIGLFVVLVVTACGDAGGTSDANAVAVQETLPPPSAVEVADQAYMLYENGDIEGWFAIWAPAATWQQNVGGDTSEFELFGAQGLFEFARQTDTFDWDGGGEITISDIEARTLAEFHASGGVWNAECSGDDGPTVTCSLDPVTAFGPWSQRKVEGARAQRARPSMAVLTITDGTIDRLELTYEILDIETVADRQNNKQAYRSWLIETYANESDQLVGGSVGELSITPDNWLRHRELVAEWAAQQ